MGNTTPSYDEQKKSAGYLCDLAIRLLEKDSEYYRVDNPNPLYSINYFNQIKNIDWDKLQLMLTCVLPLGPSPLRVLG